MYKIAKPIKYNSKNILFFYVKHTVYHYTNDDFYFDTNYRNYGTHKKVVTYIYLRTDCIAVTVV